MKYRKKPIVIEAIQWKGNCLADANVLAKKLGSFREITLSGDGGMLINTLEGTMKAQKGDWIIKGISGEIYPVKNDIFEKTYEKV